MRVLLLRRQSRGGLALWADDLASNLSAEGISATVVDAVGWIPNETGLFVDRDVTRRLRDMGEGFDIVHAFGYRAAWACAGAYGDREAWVYSAYDPPKKAHEALIDRLNESAIGICSSTLVRNVLAGAGCHSLSVSTPGVPFYNGPRLTRTEAREKFGYPDDQFLVGSFTDEGLKGALEGTGIGLIVANPNDEISLADPLIKNPGWIARPAELMAACDLWVAPDRNCGFVRNVVEAMSEGTPVLVRDGMREMIEEDVSGFVFSDDAVLGTRIRQLLEMPLTLETVGAAGRVRAHERFDTHESASRIAQLYRDVVSENYD